MRRALRGLLRSPMAKLLSRSGRRQLAPLTPVCQPSLLECRTSSPPATSVPTTPRSQPWQRQPRSGGRRIKQLQRPHRQEPQGRRMRQGWPLSWRWWAAGRLACWPSSVSTWQQPAPLLPAPNGPLPRPSLNKLPFNQSCLSQLHALPCTAGVGTLLQSAVLVRSLACCLRCERWCPSSSRRLQARGTWVHLACLPSTRFQSGLRWRRALGRTPSTGSSRTRCRQSGKGAYKGCTARGRLRGDVRPKARAVAVERGAAAAQIPPAQVLVVLQHCEQNVVGGNRWWPPPTERLVPSAACSLRCARWCAAHPTCPPRPSCCGAHHAGRPPADAELMRCSKWWAAPPRCGLPTSWRGLEAPSRLWDATQARRTAGWLK